MLRPFIKKWRGQGLRSIIYIDDGIFGTLSKIGTALACLMVREDLENAGLTINEEKSNLYPVQIGDWLGFTIDTLAYRYSVPERKVSKLMKAAETAVSYTKASGRQISAIAGLLISMGPALGPLSRLLTRKMYAFVDQSRTWDGIHHLDMDTRQEIDFWLENFNRLNGYAIKSKHAFTKIVYSDASDHSFGGFVVEKLGEKLAQGTFTDAEMYESSTFRELAAVKHVLDSFKTELAHQIVLWHSDNINTTRIINVGSPKSHLQELALEIRKICIQSDIEIISKWIPREENELADHLSKLRDTDDWSIDDETFHFIQSKFGALDIDRFAAHNNNKLPRFDSRYHCPSAETVNTFTAHWGSDFNWLCPPISLVGDVLKHARICKAKAVLFVPEWTSAYFWPLITPDGKHFHDFIKDHEVLDPFFINNCTSQSVFSGFANFRSLALSLQF